MHVLVYGHKYILLHILVCTSFFQVCHILLIQSLGETKYKGKKSFPLVLYCTTMCNTSILFIIQTLFTRQHDKCCVTRATLLELNIILFDQSVKNGLSGAGFIQRQTHSCIYTSVNRLHLYKMKFLGNLFFTSISCSE